MQIPVWTSVTDTYRTTDEIKESRCIVNRFLFPLWYTFLFSTFPALFLFSLYFSFSFFLFFFFLPSPLFRSHLTVKNQASDSRTMEYSPSRSRSDNSEGLPRFVAVRSRGIYETWRRIVVVACHKSNTAKSRIPFARIESVKNYCQ